MPDFRHPGFIPWRSQRIGDADGMPEYDGDADKDRLIGVSISNMMMMPLGISIAIGSCSWESTHLPRFAGLPQF